MLGLATSTIIELFSQLTHQIVLPLSTFVAVGMATIGIPLFLWKKYRTWVEGV